MGSQCRLLARCTAGIAAAPRRRSLSAAPGQRGGRPVAEGAGGERGRGKNGKLGGAHDAAGNRRACRLYLDYGMRIKARSPAIQTFIVQLAGPGSYVPTARSIARGAYGAVPASTEIGVEGAEALVEWSVRTLEEIMAPS